MKIGLLKSALAAVALLLSASLAPAVEVTVTSPDVTGAAKATADKTKATADAAKKSAKAAPAAAASAAKAKLVDINSASEAELRAVPGVGDTYASKIIAGRPYSNKSQLKTRNVLPAPVYDKVKDLIIAKKAVKNAVTIKK